MTTMTTALTFAATTAPEGTIDTLTLPRSFATVIDTLLAYVSTDTLRGALTGVLLECREDGAYWVATDGHAVLIVHTAALTDASGIVSGTVVLDGGSLRTWRRQQGFIRSHPDAGHFPDIRSVIPDSDRSAASCIGISTKLLARLGTVLRKLKLLKGIGEPVVMHLGGGLAPLVFSVVMPEKNVGPVRDLSCVVMPMRLREQS